ncbi:MAG: UDP-N-acetylmuramoyl-tripeptide--D-alanyl-D-alanine ligase [Rickettsiales bacterium]|jgi:UDP-N-acetylmuramoyl-tripeptide--D-alanyl-D-alanine ligase|nr:UDP-N-acetylmuramoyl-tripeptide--D-alanyl-D-alanine ligase [Rickettsiales bacterium]
MLKSYIFTFFIVIFSFFRLNLLALFYQQKEYSNRWFLKFIFRKMRLADKKLTAILLVTGYFSAKMPALIWLMPLEFLIFGALEMRALNGAKKKLAMTQRMKRILGVSFILSAIVAVFLSEKLSPIGCAVVTIQLLPFLLMLGNQILAVNEKRIQQKFLGEAKEKLKKLNPIVIGITGSFGKTSTKHILAHILSGNLPIYFTPGSVNTEMGITRVIREKLTPEHRYFVVEMGAYFKGSINRLCKFVNPQHGIITAIGQAHYEYFGSQEAVAEGKFELGEWVTKNGGILIVSGDQIAPEYIPPHMPLVKVGQNSPICASNIKMTKDGITFDFHRNGETFGVSAPIFGNHQANNIALAMEMALRLGMPINTILLTLKTLPQISHRLEVFRRENGITIIDDAYNSNRQGFKSGLELLQTLASNRRILVTPGMIELGKVHDETHYDVGRVAGLKADIAVVVIPERIPSFIRGFRETAPASGQIVEMKSFKMAQRWLDENLRPGDAVLLENDLMDVYETRLQL